MKLSAVLVVVVPTASVTLTTNDCEPSAHWVVSAKKRM
jgi:hypothetical protein